MNQFRAYFLIFSPITKKRNNNKTEIHFYCSTEYRNPNPLDLFFSRDSYILVFSKFYKNQLIIQILNFKNQTS